MKYCRVLILLTLLCACERPLDDSTSFDKRAIVGTWFQIYQFGPDTTMTNWRVMTDGTFVTREFVCSSKQQVSARAQIGNWKINHSHLEFDFGEDDSDVDLYMIVDLSKSLLSDHSLEYVVIESSIPFSTPFLMRKRLTEKPYDCSTILKDIR